MRQSRLMSLVEAVANVVVGLIVAMATQIVAFPAGSSRGADPSMRLLSARQGSARPGLVEAFVDDIEAVVLDAACIPYGEGISFLPLRELAERAATLDDDAPELVEPLSADAALAAARALFEHFTARGPLVVVVDDVHWAMPAFLDLVEYVARAVDGPLLMVSVTRPALERRGSWAEGATVLDSLTWDDAQRLVDALPERDALDERIANAIIDAAEGVPLFMEQLAAYAAESGLADDRIPPTLDALLASRIDMVEPGERAVLSRAAIVGRAFSMMSIGALTPETETREPRWSARVARAPAACPSARSGARVRPPARPQRRIRSDWPRGASRHARTLRAMARRAP